LVRELLADAVLAPDEPRLTEYLLTRVSGLPYVLRAPDHLINRSVGDAAAGGCGPLTPEQVRAVSPTPGGVPAAARRALGRRARWSSRRLREGRAGCPLPTFARRAGNPRSAVPAETVQHLLSPSGSGAHRVALSFSSLPSGCRSRLVSSPVPARGRSGWAPSWPVWRIPPRGVRGRPRATPHPGRLAATARVTYRSCSARIEDPLWRAWRSRPGASRCGR